MIKELLANNQIEIYFQPVVSLRACKIIGFEALCRTTLPEYENILPLKLFKIAAEEECLLELDRHCRYLAMQGFAQILKEHPHSLLFLNIASSVINWEIVGSGRILDNAKEMGIPPTQIVLEISESSVFDENALIQFALLHKKYGFLIGIDDLGAGNSNLIRLAQLMPDIIKIDHQLVHGIQHDHKRKQIVKFLCELSVNIGTLILAEGVEYYEEMVEFYGFGGDLCQGFYFAEPNKYPDLKLNELNDRLPSCLDHAKEAQVVKIQRSGRRIIEFQELILNVTKELNQIDRDDFDEILTQLPLDLDGCECLFIVDSKGVQLSETIMRIDNLRFRNKNLYEVAEVGAQHTYKDYYYVPMRSGLNLYTSNPYVSKATGNVCRTISVMFESKWKEKCLLCADILE